jgi:hypothetical protein
MPKMTVEIRTDENGYFSKTVPVDPPGSPQSAACLTVTLLSPFATALWGSAALEARDGTPASERRTFVAWHSETVQLEPWRLDGGENIIVLTGKTKPLRAHARLVLEIEVLT